MENLKTKVVRWEEFNRQDRIVEKQKEITFRTETEYLKKIYKIQEKSNFAGNMISENN